MELSSEIFALASFFDEVVKTIETLAAKNGNAVSSSAVDPKSGRFTRTRCGSARRC